MGNSHHNYADITQVILPALTEIVALDKRIDELKKQSTKQHHKIEEQILLRIAQEKRNEVYITCLKSIQAKINTIREKHINEWVEMSKKFCNAAPDSIDAWDFVELSTRHPLPCYPTAEQAYEVLLKLVTEEEKAKLESPDQPKEQAKAKVVTPATQDSKVKKV